MANDEKSIARTDERVVESLALRGDISGLSPQDRIRYYLKTCKELGLNASAQPFAFLRLSGKEVMYPTRGATDQLARIHGVNREIIDGPKVIDLAGSKVLFAVCRASIGQRVETATAAVPLPTGAENICNAVMKTETKARRRATLAILGLALQDESELDTIPRSQREEIPTPTREELARAEAEDVEVVEAEDVEVVEAEPAEEPAKRLTAESLIASLGRCGSTGEVARVWHAARADVAAWENEPRQKAWKAGVRRVGEIERCDQPAAKAKLTGSVAEITKAAADRAAQESRAVLGAIEGASDVADVCTRLVGALAAYPALSDALWSTATGAAGRLGCDEATLRRMVQERQDGPGDGPDGPRGGSKPAARGQNTDARGGAQGGAAANDGARASVRELVVVSDVAQGIMDRHRGASEHAVKASIKKHSAELRMGDVMPLARFLASEHVAPARDGTRPTLVQAEKDVRALTGLCVEKRSAA